jgi:hypothetical protein
MAYEQCSATPEEVLNETISFMRHTMSIARKQLDVITMVERAGFFTADEAGKYRHRLAGELLGHSQLIQELLAPYSIALTDNNGRERNVLHTAGIEATTPSYTFVVEAGPFGEVLPLEDPGRLKLLGNA